MLSDCKSSMLWTPGILGNRLWNILYKFSILEKWNCLHMEIFRYNIIFSQNNCRFREVKTHWSVRVRYICNWQSASKRLSAVTHVLYTEYICIFIYELNTSWNSVYDNENTDRLTDEHLGFSVKFLLSTVKQK